MNLFRLNLIAGGFVLTATAAFVLGLLVPGTRALEVRHQRLTEELRGVADMQRQLGSLGDLYSRVLSMNEQLKDYSRRLPADNKIAEFANEVAGQLDSVGITGYSVQPMRAMRVASDSLPPSLALAANVRILPIGISFESGFEQAFAFLGRLETLERLAHIELFDAQNHEERPGQIRVRLVLHTYQNPEDDARSR